MLSDVIAALATTPGRGAIAVVRMSGAGCHDIAARSLASFDASDPRRVRHTRAVNPQTSEVLDDVLYTVWSGPNSYTGEDMVEISTHGGVLTPTEVLSSLLQSGARIASAGEFTRRAVVNGKMDLLQAEAVGDLIDATASAQRRMAMAQFDRGLSARIDGLRQAVLELEALISYEIDFPEEDDGPVPEERIKSAFETLRRDLRALVASSKGGERVRSGALVVIAGRPNVGKSSLFNALVGSDRAIVTHIPGTTRDAVETPVECGGFPFRLVDTAGLRATEDAVEALGIEVSRRYLEQADLILVCVEAMDDLSSEEQVFFEAHQGSALLIRTKRDLADQVHGAGVGVSVETGDGVAELRDALAERAFGDLSGGSVDAVLTRERHRVALTRGAEELDAFWDARGTGLETVVAATHLRAVVGALEEVIGVVTTDDMLDRLFSSFCVGK
jgi:tRNA modification GTPase